MGWDEVSNAISVLGFISTIIALVGVVWGVYVAGRQLTISKARDVLGKTSLNGSLMGCYVTNVPHMWAIVPFWWKPNPPLVTSISALIQSGDSDLFSSAMFDWMPPRYSPVSWRPFYDAFYLECAWAFDEGRLEVEDLLPAMSDELPKERLKHHYEYLAYARDEVVRAKKQAENASKANFRYPDFLRPLLAFRQESRRADNLIRVHKDKIADIDPHLLYYPWKVIQDEAGVDDMESAPGSIQMSVQGSHPVPLLMRAIRPLKAIPVRDPSQGVKRIRPTIVEDDYDLWIYHDKPCVRVFAEELAAMMFVLGITYGESDSVGAFGTILTTHKDGHYSTMRLAHSRWETKLHLGGGSGYSTIFAKHMACGCLPFAETVGAEGTPVVHTIMISKATKEVLISGGVILDDKPPGTSPTTQSWKYLGSLPSIAGHGLFYPISSESEYLTTYLKDTKPETGAIYWKFNPNNPKDRSVDAELIASWRDAVAGIAFGGLVPMASNHLVDTIVWSVGGELEGRDFKKLLELLVVIDRHAAERIGVEVVPIFSAGVQRIAAMMSDFGDVDSDYYLFDKFRSSVEATWSLDQLTTALEYLLAWAGSPTNNGGLPEKRVSNIECAFKSCANKVGESMKSKGKQKQSNEKTEVEIILEEVIRKLQGKEERPSLDDCGKVAWCIIKAWTQLVKKVSWPDDGEEPQSYEYRPPRLEQLPHVLAWE